VPGHHHQQQQLTPNNKRKRSNNINNNSTKNPPNVDDDDDEPEETNDDHSSHPQHNNKQRRTAQEAWIMALQSFATNEDSCNQDFPALVRLAKTSPSSSSSLPSSSSSSSFHCSIPRKYKPFQNYVRRNQRRLFPNNNEEEMSNTKESLEHITKEMYRRLKARCKEYMNLPPPTLLEESALGQLQLCYGRDDEEDDDDKFKVVHRLDCETSGVMVFAKSSNAASFLCRAWRGELSLLASSTLPSPPSLHQQPPKDDGITVQKVYLAMVREWLPLQKYQQTSGIINLAMQPSTTESLKWEVTPTSTAASDKNNGKTSNKAKQSQTKWKVLQVNHPLPDWCHTVYSSTGDRSSNDHDSDNHGNGSKMTGIVLELQPITGRTHQLRVHCAHLGSGIVGDSLYGKDRCPYSTASSDGPHLLLHAWKLTFPRPTSPIKATTIATSFTYCSYSKSPEWFHQADQEM
jgi:23S rRNA-/tRNA-specific pseudouridylate synthase